MWKDMYRRFDKLLRDGAPGARHLPQISIVGGDWNQIWWPQDSSRATDRINLLYNVDSWCPPGPFDEYDLFDSKANGILFIRSNMQSCNVGSIR